MPEILVATRGEFADRKVRVKVVDGREVGIFLLADGQFQQFSLAFSTVEDAEALARLEQLDGAAAVAAFEAVRGELVL